MSSPNSVFAEKGGLTMLTLSLWQTDVAALLPSTRMAFYKAYLTEVVPFGVDVQEIYGTNEIRLLMPETGEIFMSGLVSMNNQQAEDHVKAYNTQYQNQEYAEGATYHFFTTEKRIRFGIGYSGHGFDDIGNFDPIEDAGIMVDFIQQHLDQVLSC